MSTAWLSIVKSTALETQIDCTDDGLDVGKIILCSLPHAPETTAVLCRWDGVHAQILGWWLETQMHHRDGVPRAVAGARARRGPATLLLHRLDDASKL